MQATAWIGGWWSRAMAIALVGSAVMCIALAAGVNGGTPPAVQPPPPLEIDCTPRGVELTKAQIARMERHAHMERGELVRWLRLEASKRRHELRRCGASELDDPCFDLRRDLWLAQTVYSVALYVERARGELEACMRRGYRW